MPIYTNYTISNSVFDTQINNIIVALNTFFKNDSYLVKNNLHEVSLSHRIALYLDETFPNYNVDCEWNKNINNTKSIFTETILEMVKSIIREWNQARNRTKFDDDLLMDLRGVEKLINFEDNQNESLITDLSGDDFLIYPEKDEKGRRIIKNVRPDIVIHHRGTRDNVFVIEIKKKEAGGAKRYKSAKNFDLIKLYALTTQPDLNYKAAFFIELPKPDFVWTQISVEKSKFIDLLFGVKANKVFEITFK